MIMQKKFKTKNNDELRLYLKQDLFLLDDWKLRGRSTRRLIFQAKEKKNTVCWKQR